MSPEVYEELRKEFGFDKPWYEQYVDYLGDLLHGDLGVSVTTGRSVKEILQATYPYTMKLAFAAILIEAFVGITAGIVSAVKRYSFWDVFVTLSTSILVALPVFWLGIMLQYIFGIWLKDVTGGRFYLPISGAQGSQFPDFAYLILPAVTLAAVSTAYAARIMRSQLLEVLGQDYIRTAIAKGLTWSQVLRGHAMKNALIPVVTFIGIDLGAMLSGAVLTETVFNWPGVGWTIYRAIQARDYPVVFGGTILILFAVLFINLLVDVSYAFLDPRIRYGGGGGGE
jgi:peptide/nickel transport system permease protein